MKVLNNSLCRHFDGLLSMENSVVHFCLLTNFNQIPFTGCKLNVVFENTIGTSVLPMATTL